MILLNSCAVPVEPGPGDGQSSPPVVNSNESSGPAMAKDTIRCRPVLNESMELIAYTCAVPPGPFDPVLEQEIVGQELEMDFEYFGK